MMIEPFRHNSWATQRLLDFCRELDPALLEATARGTYGSIQDTLAHLVGTEESLVGIVEGIPPAGLPPPFASLEDLHERSRWLSERWERALEGDVHPERLVETDRSSGRLVRVGTVLAQTVYHGTHYRAHVCIVLSTVDIQPPALDGWAYGAWLSERPERRYPRREPV
jgi:uncharacterized damage-inducible protein DinB